MSASIPTTVTRSEIKTALTPLLDLLSVSYNDVYENPGIVFGHSRVSFVIAAGAAQDEDGRAESLHAADIPGVRPARYWDELGIPVSVEVVEG